MQDIIIDLIRSGDDTNIHIAVSLLCTQFNQSAIDVYYTLKKYMYFNDTVSQYIETALEIMGLPELQVVFMDEIPENIFDARDFIKTVYPKSWGVQLLYKYANNSLLHHKDDKFYGLFAPGGYFIILKEYKNWWLSTLTFDRRERSEIDAKIYSLYHNMIRR